MAYVSNRFQVAAFDLKEGRRTWQSGVGGEHARTHDWTLTPMRPLVVGDRLYGAPAQIAGEPTLPRYFLHAHRIRFAQPSTGEPVTVESPLTADLEAWANTL